MFQISNIMILMISLCLSTISYAQDAPQKMQLPKEFTQIFNQKRFANAQWWLLVKDLNTNQTLYEMNANQMLMPASVTKMFTAMTALNDLGFDYRFKTPIYFMGKRNGNVLDGDLILVGMGDLTLGGRVQKDKLLYGYIDHIYANDLPGASIIPIDPLSGLIALARQIKAQGITKINGDILIDDRAFETTYLRDYTLSPIMINENLIDVQIKPSRPNTNASIHWRPEVPGYQVINEVKTVERGGKTDVNITSNPENNIFYVKGTIAADSKEILRVDIIKHPAQFARLALIQVLEKMGIQVDLSKSPHPLPEKNAYLHLKPIAEYVSPPLTEYVKVILKLSQNIGADLLPFVFGAHHGLTTFDADLPLISDFLINKVHINRNDFVFNDGAGGDNNRLTPTSTIQLLTYIHQLPKIQYQKFYDTLPILGVDGSLEKASTDSPAIGKVHAKTGTSIRYDFANKRFYSFSETLAGFIEAKNGHTLAFIVGVSNTPMDSIEDEFIIQREVSALASAIYRLQ